MGGGTATRNVAPVLKIIFLCLYRVIIGQRDRKRGCGQENTVCVPPLSQTRILCRDSSLILGMHGCGQRIKKLGLIFVVKYDYFHLS